MERGARLAEPHAHGRQVVDHQREVLIGMCDTLAFGEMQLRAVLHREPYAGALVLRAGDTGEPEHVAIEGGDRLAASRRNREVDVMQSHRVTSCVALAVR